MRIFVVDDDRDLAESLAEVLELSGHEVEIAFSGEQAVEIFRQKDFDISFMDVVMPGMNGFQATRKLSRNPTTSSIPIVIVSGKGQETDRIWGLRQGAAQYLVKPVDEQELAEAVEAALSV